MSRQPSKPTHASSELSSQQLNRLSIYLRCLKRLREEGVAQVSSQTLADRFDLSAPLIRKDLAHFGELGIRGHGYDVEALLDRLLDHFGLENEVPVIVVGMGKLGSALAGHFDGSHGVFHVVAGFDDSPTRVGLRVGAITVRPVEDIAGVVETSGAQIGLLTVPRSAAQETLDRMTEAGIRSVLNFAPARLTAPATVHLRNVDLGIHLEELAFLIHAEESR